jgi:hypothetical protein
MRKVLFAIQLCLLSLSGCGDAGTATRDNNFTPLTAIEISAQNLRIANQTSTQFRAVGNFSNLFTRDITSEVIWSSGDPAVATISTSGPEIGRARAQSPGTTSIRALRAGIETELAFEVSAASADTLDISPLAPALPKGLTTDFQASGSFSDGTTQDLTFDVTWVSSTPSVATISNAAGSRGLATAVAVGTSNLSAEFNGLSAATQLTVSAATLESIALSPLNPSILSLSGGQFTATGTFSDASSADITDQVSWGSSLPTVATVSDAGGTKGQVSTLINGTTTISVDLDNIRASTRLTVTGGNLTAIKVLPADSTQVHLSPVLEVQMRAQGTFANAAREITSQVVWSSSDARVATINNLGLVTTVGAGVTEIKAVSTTSLGSITGTSLLTVNQANYVAGNLTISPATIDMPTIARNTSRKFTVSGRFSDGITRDLTRAVTWTSSAPAVAEISNVAPYKGMATAVAAGSTNISADFRGLDSVFATLKVTAPTLSSLAIDNLSPSVRVGDSLQLTATAGYSDGTSQKITADVTWTAADSSLAVFHDPLEHPGEIRGVSSGSVEISATFGGKTASLSLVVP